MPGTVCNRYTGYGRHGAWRFAAGECDVAKRGIVIGEERAIHCDALGHRRLGNALGRRLGWFCRRSLCRWPRGETGCGYCGQRPGVRRVGGPGACVDAAGPRSRAAQPERPRPCEAYRRAATRRCAGRRSCRFGLAAMDGLHGEGMTEDARDTVCGPEVSQPVPGQHACGQPGRPERGRGAMALRKRFGGGGHVTVHQRFTSLVEDARPCVRAWRSIPQSKGVVGCRSALRSPPCSLRGFWPLSACHAGLLGRGLNKYQSAAGDGKQRPLVPRSHCLPRLKRGVRSRIYLMRNFPAQKCADLYPQTPHT